MYHAKEQGRNTYRFYTPQMHATSMEQLTLSNDLRYALERGELHLCYQPQVSFETGGLIGVEALLRWIHPKLGMIPLIALSLWPKIPFDRADRDLGVARSLSAGHDVGSQGLPSLRVAVNISAKQFGSQISAIRSRQSCRRPDWRPTCWSLN